MIKLDDYKGTQIEKAFSDSGINKAWSPQARAAALAARQRGAGKTSFGHEYSAEEHQKYFNYVLKHAKKPEEAATGFDKRIDEGQHPSDAANNALAFHGGRKKSRPKKDYSAYNPHNT